MRGALRGPVGEGRWGGEAGRSLMTMIGDCMPCMTAEFWRATAEGGG